MFKLLSRTRGFAKRIPVYGVCRFSYPSPGFKHRLKTLEALRAFLYDPVRLDARFTLFETVTVPTLAAQTHPDFTFLILVGSDLPAAYMDRLRAAIAPVPGARIVPHEPMAEGNPANFIMRREMDGTDQPVIQFRLDDDDGVSVDYVEELRAMADRQRVQFERKGNVAFDLSLGLCLTWDNDLIGVERLYRQNVSMGLACLTRMNRKQTIMKYAHLTSWRSMSYLSQADRPYFIASRHRHRDTVAQTTFTPKEPLSQQAAADQLRDRFGLSLEALEAVSLPLVGSKPGQKQAPET